MSEQEVEVDHLLQQLTFGEDPFASFITNSTAAGLPEIQVSTVFGRYLEVMARLIQAKVILEIGTLGGYSAAWMASALPEDGKLVSLEIDPHHAEVATANLASVGLADRVDIRVAPAMMTLGLLKAEPSIAGHVDMAFIDADKELNAFYLDLAVELAHRGSLVIVDNVVRSGGILDTDSDDMRIQGTLAVLERLNTHPRLCATALQTVGLKHHDGFAIAVVT